MGEGIKNYLELKDLEAYKLARLYSREAWVIYESLDWRQRKIIGDQTITSIDSVGANIAEGYGRFHYLDKIKFYYNARGSLLESRHWVNLMFERNLITEKHYQGLIHLTDQVGMKLNGLIKSQHQRKQQ